MRTDSSAETQPFSGRAVQRAVLAEALQHPTTLYPFAAGCLAGIYAAFFSPFVGGTVPAIALALGAGAVAAASFGWRYLVQGEQIAREKARQQIAAARARREVEDQALIEQQRAGLAARLTAAGAADAAEVLNELVAEWGRLRPLLEEARGDGASGERLVAGEEIARSAAEAYRRGIEMLELVLEISESVDAADRAALETEIRELRAELATLAARRASEDHLRVTRELLASHQRGLELLTEQELQVERLVREAELARAALLQLRVALPAISLDRAPPSINETAALLQRTIERERRVQQRLRGGLERDEATDELPVERERVR